jgi:hypothetical protein
MDGLGSKDEGGEEDEKERGWWKGSELLDGIECRERKEE